MHDIADFERSLEALEIEHVVAHDCCDAEIQRLDAELALLKWAKRRLDESKVADLDWPLGSGREHPLGVAQAHNCRSRVSGISHSASTKALDMTMTGYQRPASTSPERATSHAAVSGMKPPNQALVRW